MLKYAGARAKPLTLPCTSLAERANALWNVVMAPTEADLRPGQAPRVWFPFEPRRPPAYMLLTSASEARGVAREAECGRRYHPRLRR